MIPRIPQPLSYHSFADQRSFLEIPNFGDVVSNLPFAVIGIWSLVLLLRSPSRNSTGRFLGDRERLPYVFVFTGLLLTAFGSSYYHLAPDNELLVWDRLPITITFTSGSICRPARAAGLLPSSSTKSRQRYLTSNCTGVAVAVTLGS